MTQDPFRLDPSRFPKRLDLELSEEVLHYLEAAEQRFGGQPPVAVCAPLRGRVAQRRVACSGVMP